MVAASYAAPGPGGIWRLDVSRETQTFGAAAPLRFEETRTRAGVEIGNWIDQRTRLRGGAAIESWSDRPRTAARLRPRGVLAGRRSPGARGRRRDLARSGRLVRRRGRRRRGGDRRPRSPGRCGGSTPAIARRRAASPASIWPGADTGHARDVLLRAHPLLDDGIVGDGVFGRRLAFGTLEVQRWLKPGARPVRVAPAAFVDIARASRGPPVVDRSHPGGRRRRPQTLAAGDGRPAHRPRARPARRAHRVLVGWQR